MSDAQVRFIKAKELAGFAGVSVRRIQQLTQDGVIQSQVNGKNREYEFLPTVQELLKYYREKGDKKNTPKGALEREKLRQMAAKAELAEIKLKEVKSELHHTADIEAVFGALLTRLRTNLLALPQGVAPKLLDQSDINVVVEVLSERLRRCLTEVSAFDFKAFHEVRGDYVEEVQKQADEDAEDG